MAQDYSDLDQGLLQEAISEAADLYHRGISVPLAARRVIDRRGLPDKWRKAICAGLGQRGAQVLRSRPKSYFLSEGEIASLVDRKMKEGVPYFRALKEVWTEKRGKIEKPIGPLFSPIAKILAKRRRRRDPQLEFFRND